MVLVGELLQRQLDVVPLGDLKTCPSEAARTERGVEHGDEEA